MSADIQNEMLKILSQTILLKLIAAFKDKSRIFSGSLTSGKTITNSYVFSLIADETSDISNREKVSICICHCTSSLESDEVFSDFLKLINRFKYIILLGQGCSVKAWFGYFLSSWAGV